mgnify:FL=1
MADESAGVREIVRTWLMPDYLSPQIQRILLGVLLLGFLGLRVATMHAPAIDRTSWKEIDYITISTNYWEHGYRFHEPQIEWPAEPPRVTAMELPLVPYVAALGYPIFGVNEYSVRWLTVAALAMTLFYLFFLVRREVGPLPGLLAVPVAGIMLQWHPDAKFLFSDPWVIALSLGTLYHLGEYAELGGDRQAWLGGAFFSIMVAIKLTPLYMLLPVAWIGYRSWGLRFTEWLKGAGIIAAAMIVPTAWYAYAYYLGETSIDVFGIFGGHNKLQTAAMLSSSEWWATMTDRIRGTLLDGNLGFLLLLLGLGTAVALKRAGLFLAYGIAVAAFFAIVAEGQIDAPYRQLMAVPVLATFVALGVLGFGAVAATLTERVKVTRGLFRKPGLVLFGGLAVTLFMGFRSSGRLLEVEPTQPDNMAKWELAEALKATGEDYGPIIALGEYTIHKGGNDLSPGLYYYANTRGWTLQRGDWCMKKVLNLRDRGATHLTAYRMDRQPGAIEFVENVRRCFPLEFENPQKHTFLVDLSTVICDDLVLREDGGGS